MCGVFTLPKASDRTGSDRSPHCVLLNFRAKVPSPGFTVEEEEDFEDATSSEKKK